MDDTEAAFLARIIDDPADDSRRLVFADWLAANGQESRAEFIRARVAFDGKRPEFGEYPRIIERLRACDYSPPEVELQDGFTFRPNLGGPVNWLSDSTTGMDRGLPSLAEFDGGGGEVETAQLLSDGLTTLVGSTPIRGVHLQPDLNHHSSALFGHPAAANLRQLSISFYGRRGGLCPEAVSLARSAVARTLTHLTLYWELPNDQCVDALAAAPFDRLRRLATTARWNCTFVAARRLLEAEWFGRLEFLITAVPPGAFGPQTLPDLHTLAFQKPSDGDFKSFALNADLPVLRRFSLLEADLMSGRADALAALRCGDLVELWLSHCRFDLVDLRRLLSAPWARRLEVLTIAGGGDRHEVEQAIRDSPCGKTLKHLLLA